MARRDVQFIPWGALDNALDSVSIGDLGDVTITSAATGNTLYWNGSEWVNTNDWSRRQDAQYDLSAAGASANPALWFVDSGLNDLAVLFYDESFKYVTLQGRKADSELLIQMRNAADSAQHTLITGDPDAEVGIYHNNTLVAQTVSNGLELQEVSTESRLYLGTAGSGGLLRYDNGALYEIYGYDHGVPFQIRLETASGTARTMLVADPDDSVKLYYLGSEHLTTDSVGAAIRRGGSNYPALSFYNSSDVRTGYIQSSDASNNLVIQNEVHSGPMLLRGENAGGTLTTMMTLNPVGPVTINYSGGGLVCGAPTGGNKGGGTINASAVYDDNTLLTDYVFDAHIDGRIDRQKWDDLVPDRVIVEEDGTERVEVRVHEPARRFNQADLDPKTYAQKWQARRRLPAFDSPTGEPEQLPVGGWAQRLLETCEVQAIHIEQLRQRIEALEGVDNGTGPVAGPN